MTQLRHLEGAPQSQGGRFRSQKDGIGDGGVTLGPTADTIPFAGSVEHAEWRFSASDMPRTPRA